MIFCDYLRTRSASSAAEVSIRATSSAKRFIATGFAAFTMVCLDMRSLDENRARRGQDQEWRRHLGLLRRNLGMMREVFL